MAALLTGCLKETPLPEAPPFQHTYGGPRNEVAGGLTTTPDGGFVLVGGSQNDQEGSYDLYIVKIDADGKFVFANTKGDATYDEIGWKVIPADNGGYAVFGTRTLGQYASSEFVMTMLDADLAVVKQTVSPTILPNTGFTPQNASFYRLQDGSYFVGFVSDNYPIVLRFAADGTLVSEDGYSDYNDGKYNHVFCKTSDGSIYAFVSATEYNGLGNGFDVLKFDAYGNYSGYQTILGIPSNYPRVYAAATTHDDRFVLSLRDQYNGQHLLVFLDSNFVLSYTTGRQDQPYYAEITALSGGKLLLTGFDAVEYDYGFSDNFRTALLDSVGNDILSISYGGQATDRLRECLYTGSGRTVLFGETQSYGAGGSDLFLIFFTQ